MIDIRLIRAEPDRITADLARRGTFPIGEILELDRERRELMASTESARARQKELRASPEAAELKRKITDGQSRIAELDSEIERALLDIPNLPESSIPDSGNRVEKTVGETRSTGEAHWDIATRLGLCDFERGVKIAGSRFYALTGAGARLERALIAFMLDHHIRAGYTEISPPLLANIESMTGTGQYPKFQEEYFACEKDALALIPTGEVPVTNFHRDEILDELPKKYVACTPCFRRESGAAGKDTRGVIRVHQFNKVELVRFVRPEESQNALEELTREAEEILEALGLPYRRVLLAADDLGFASAKTYDLEVWMAGTGRYVEVSSCSNFTDYQARRMKIRFKRDKASKPELLHTLNGSALALSRTWAAILENGLQKDGSVKLPEVLGNYMGGTSVIGA